jgi:hypothetical protein
MSEQIVRTLQNEIIDLDDRLSRLAERVRTVNERLQIDPGGSDRLDAIDEALVQLAARVAALEREVASHER